MNRHIKAILNSYSEVLFLQGGIFGLVMILATLLDPNVAAGGILAAVAAYLFALFIHMDQTFLGSGFYIYNPILVGLSIGYLFRITPLTIFFIVVAAILTFLVTHLLHSVFSYYLRLPVLSLPFVIISSLVYLASSRYSNLLASAMNPSFVLDMEAHLPVWLTGYLKSLSAILFVPNVVSGAVLLVMIMCASRIMFLLTVLGYYTGTFITALMVGSVQQAFTNINHFDYIWIAIALGGIFLIPSVKSYVLTVVGVAVSTFVLTSTEVFWSSYGIPAFALPFNVVTLTFVYVLGATGFPLLTRLIQKTPEESLDYYLSTQLRFKGHDRTLHLPFSGKWMVWQGFDGDWTHQGSWRYAYDFILAGEDDKTFQNDGARLEDYYAYRKPVLAPVRGRIVRVVDAFPDNDIGRPDKTLNWGNAVTMYDERGFWVEISHFSTGTIKVTEGQWVERGALLGLCGNSGYSPQPHIHIQVQAAETEGSMTLPFSFVDYVTESDYHANDLPERHQTVEALKEDRAMDLKMSFTLDESYRYEIRQNGSKIAELILTVRMAPDGTFYLDSGKGKLYFGKQSGTFYFYRLEGRDPYLKALFVALPRLPLAYREDLKWKDYVPVATVSRGWRKNLVLFLSSFCHALNKIPVQCTYCDPQTIVGSVQSATPKFSAGTRVELGDPSGLAYIQMNALELTLIDTEDKP